MAKAAAFQNICGKTITKFDDYMYRDLWTDIGNQDRVVHRLFQSRRARFGHFYDAFTIAGNISIHPQPGTGLVVAEVKGVRSLSLVST